MCNEEENMLKVLIADDEEKICQLIIKLINWEEMGLKIAATASNGIEALEQAKICKPEILITDIRMPGIDGRFFRNYPFLCFPTYLSFASNKRFLQRPYIVRFIIFNRLFVPSTKPLL